MNTDLLTFFSSLGAGEETIRAFTVELLGVPHIEILIFSRERINLSLSARLTINSDEEYKSLIRNFKEALSPGGGLLAELQPHNGFTRMALTVVRAQGFKPSRQMLRLSPAGPAKFEDLCENPDDIALGDHLVVPVSIEAENRLLAFCEELKGFPADLEASILNVIRRPSLEWRIERIESHLRSLSSLSRATWAEEQRSRASRETFVEKLRRLFMRPIPIGPVVALLLLTAGAVAGYDKFLGSDQDSMEKGLEGTELAVMDKVAASSGDSREKSAEAPAAKEEESKTDVQSSLDELFQTLADSENAALTKLYDSHFRDHAKDAFGQGSPVVWGIAKLEALKLGMIEEEDGLLANVQTRTPLKKIFEKPENSKALAKDKSAFRLLAWSSCQRFGEPELKVNSTDPGPYSFKIDSNCNELASDAIAGLKDLTEWVQEKK